MAKSLGEYTLSKTSSVAGEVKWTKKNPAEPKPKKKKKKAIPPTNVIPSSKVVEPVEKTFKVSEKPKKKKSGKKFEKSDLTSDKIEQGYRRPGR